MKYYYQCNERRRSGEHNRSNNHRICHCCLCSNNDLCHSLHLGPGLPTLQAGGCEAAAALLPAEAVTPGPAWRRYARLAAADPRVASYLAARRSPALATHLQLPFVRQFALTEGTQGYSGDIQTQTMDSLSG